MREKKTRLVFSVFVVALSILILAFNVILCKPIKASAKTFSTLNNNDIIYDGDVLDLDEDIFFYNYRGVLKHSETDTYKYTFTMPDADVTVSAFFERIDGADNDTDKEQETNDKSENYKDKIPVCTFKTINKGTGVKIIVKNASDFVNLGILYRTDKCDYKRDPLNGALFREINDYFADSDHKDGIYIIEGLPKGSYTFAVVAKDARGSWCSEPALSKSIKIKDAPKSKIEEPIYDFSSVKAGDVITFGRYEQDDNMLNGKEPIEWIVLSKSKDKIFVLSKKVLDNCTFYGKTGTWEDSYVRQWLNKEFYNAAFTKKEKNMISKTKLKNPGNKEYKTEDENNTKDKVFLLSLAEATNKKFGFSTKTSEDSKRVCSMTKYALVQGVRNYGNDSYYGGGWWLRTSGHDRTMKVYVGAANGGISLEGRFDDVFDANDMGIRPAMYIKIK